MSLTAQIALDPSRRVAWAQRAVPLFGLVVAAATLALRWPASSMFVLSATILAALPIAIRSRRSRAEAGPYRLVLSARPEFGVVLPDGSSFDARLVESTVAWPGFWMLALGATDRSRVIRLAVLPSALRPDVKWSLARFVFWASVAGIPSDDAEKPLR